MPYIMSSIRSTSSHLKGVAHPSNKANNCYNIRANTSSALETVKGGNMGGMVSAITAVFCGPGKHADKDNDKTLGERQYHILNEGTNISTPTPTLSVLNSNGHHNDMDEDSTALDSSVSCDASYRTAEGSVSEFVDKFERSTGSPRIDNQRLDIPFMDESSASSSCVSSPREVKQSESYNFQNVGASEWRITDGNKRNYTEEVIEISETEYSADEEQSEVEDDHSDAEELERTRSDTEEEGLEEEHDCDSECEHSHEEVDYESEVGSDREDIRDSDCEYVEEESAEESEYESEIEHSGSENDEEEVIEISENEASCDEEQDEEQESNNEEIIECECDSNCESDCDGNHHECSSNCGCDPYESESGDDSNDKLQLVDKPQREPPASQLNGTNHNKPLPPPRHSLNRASSFPNGDPVPSPNPVERNNNRLQRNYSQRIPQRSPEDMLGELKTALDARVRRSASCRETTIDYRKRYAHLSSNENSIAENFSKLDIKDREIRRKERRSRLRTLELKREQCLDEVRDGTEHNVTDRVYREACL